MTVQEFVNAVAQNPKLSELELGVVTKTEKIAGGEFDGSVQMCCSPIQGIVLGAGGLLIFRNPALERKEVIVADITQYPPCVIAGSIPDTLK